ncbi:M23 family metallopeptidase [Maribacter algarum]|uniref:M23 family metallopeptidase n=2 Tax=Maribacter algarum (ex Zhang et al. 2020) TaxID=2578118 RepID=A0A5S3PUH4_9FLAO|nr:M23 family metallopeptidase [Maribacter algarum]
MALSSCGMSANDQKALSNSGETITDTIFLDSIPNKRIEIDSSKIAFGFDFPVGKPDAKGYYDYQGFTKNNHLGEDWNGVGGSNTDLGDTIYAIGNGQVTYAEDFGGGWGNTVRIVHELPNGSKYESVYAHCDTILTIANAWVIKGDHIGTIGTAHGQYLAHLHLEIREEVGLPIGNGYSTDTTGYVNPTAFITANRQISNEIDDVSTKNQ